MLFCHQLDNIHVKGNFLLFGMSVKVMAILWEKLSQKYSDWTSTFAALAKKASVFFRFFSQVQSRSDVVCVVLPST